MLPILPAATGSSGQAVINAFPCYPNRNDEFSRENQLGKWQANLNEKRTALDQRETKLTEQKTMQDQRETMLTEQKTTQDQREAKLTEQKTRQDQQEAKLIEQKTALDKREAEMGQPRVEPDDNALQTKKRARETDFEFLVKAANCIFKSEWADDEMKQDIKAKIRKLTNPE